MQADQTTVVKTVLWSVIVSALVLLVAGIFAVSSINNNLQSITMPTAEAISAAVLAGIVIPDMPDYPEYEEVDMSKVNNLWCEMFGEDAFLNALESDAEAEVISEFDSDDAVEELEKLQLYPEFYELVGNFELDEDETKVKIVESGEWTCDEYTESIAEGGDREVTVVLTYDFEYNREFESGFIGLSKGTLTVTGTYTQDYDKDDEVYEDAEVSDLDYSYSLI